VLLFILLALAAGIGIGLRLGGLWTMWRLGQAETRTRLERARNWHPW
jgi:hypothetical protein